MDDSVRPEGAELAAFLRDFAAIVQPLLANAPGKGRRRRTVYTIFLPERRRRIV